MGKENYQANYQAPGLDELISKGINIQYSGDNVDRLARTRDTVNFHKQIQRVRSRQRYTEEYLRDVCAAFRVQMVKSIDEPRKRIKGSRLVGTYDDQLQVDDINDISARKRFVYLIKLHEYFSQYPELYTNKINLVLIENNIKRTLREVRGEVKKLLNCLASQEALANDLKYLFSKYKELKGRRKEKLKVTPEFWTQFAEGMEDYIEHSAELKKVSNEVGFNRAWRLQVGTYLFIMLSAEDPELRAYCAARLGKIDNYIKHECLSTFRSFMMDTRVKGHIESFCKEKYRDQCSFLVSSIDGSLEKHEETLNQAIRDSRSDFQSCFPTLTLAFGVIGAIAFSTVLGGAAAATAVTVTQTDAMVPVLMAASKGTAKLMHYAVGDMGKNMSYRATELGASCILSNGLTKLFSAVGNMAGFAAGAIPGAALDFSIDTINKLRAAAKIPPDHIKNEEVEFMIALLKLPPNLALEEHEILKYRTQGLLFQPAPVAALAPPAPAQERRAQPG